MDPAAPHAASRDRLRAAADEFFDNPLDTALTRHRRESPRDRVVELFRRAAAGVPAYARFLADQGVDPAAVHTFADFEALPLMTRDGYLAKSAIEERAWGGRLAAADLVSVSSGSTGEPTFWPRSLADEYGVARRFEQVFVDAFRAHERTTLAVVCFPLGTWVGGLYTTGACRHLAAKGYPITTIAPGNVRDEILRVTFALAPKFDQVVLLGYPPFLKDVVDTARARGLTFGAPPVRLVLAGEVISEPWRTLMAERLGGADPCRDFASLYGTADGGVLGNETPLSIAIRRFLADRPDLAREIFGEARLPTLVQYDPSSRFFEAHGGTLLFSADGTVPLVRYHIADTGGLFGFDELVARVRAAGFDPGAAPVRELPFAYVFGRSHFAISYFGANVYPENVSVGLEQPEVREWVTGKFVLESREDADRDRFVFLAVELAPGEADAPARREIVARNVREHVARLNGEFRTYVPADRQTPVVELRPFGDPEVFPVGVKHRYTRGPR